MSERLIHRHRRGRPHAQYRFSGVVILAAAVWLIGCTTTPATAQGLEGRLQTLLDSSNLGQAKLAVAVKELDEDAWLAEIKADESMIPASNMKLVTTAAALDALGHDFEFTTSLALLNGNLILHGTGDPAFGDPKLLEEMDMDLEDLLARWVKQVKEAGLTNIPELIIDDRVFDTDFEHENWPDNQRHLWYCAGVGGINFNTNCLDVYASPTRVGQAPTVKFMPLNPPVHIFNRARTGKRTGLWADRKPGTNDIYVRGLVRHRLVKPIHVTVHDPPMFFGQTFRDRLKQAGIEVGSIRRARNEERFDRAKLLAVVRTQMPTILQRCLRDSQNLYGEALLKRTGHVRTGEPGSWLNGTAAARMFLARELGASASAIIVDDGSGMSRDNRVSARQLVRVLDHLHDQPDAWPVLRDAMAWAEEDQVTGRVVGTGTLRNRFGKAQLEGRVLAKSGYISGVVALSGYVLHDDRATAFAILFNDFKKPVHLGKRTIDQLVEAIDAYMATHHSQVQYGG